MNYRSINDINNTILRELHIFPRDIDLIVGIPRSGMMPANLLALYLNLPYTDIDSFMKGCIYKSGARKQFFSETDYKKILVVDDSIASGAALTECKKDLTHLTSKFDIKYCVIYYTPEKENLADYALEAVPTPRYFQWNIFNHSTLDKACFDIDGVLCVDPLEVDNDDGLKYKAFLQTASPLLIPGSKIGTIVTSRLEKYRSETETWLKDNGVKYNNLVMLDMPNMKARKNANNHAAHKAKEYKKSKYSLFVESDLRQAIEINIMTKKPVFCTANFQMIYESESLIYNLKSGKHFPFVRRLGLQLRKQVRRVKNQLFAKVSPNVSTTTNV